jgi:hypothetical protein
VPFSSGTSSQSCVANYDFNGIAEVNEFDGFEFLDESLEQEMSSFLASHSEESVAALIDSVTDSINTPVLATEDKEEQFQQTLIPPQEEVHSKSRIISLSKFS